MPTHETTLSPKRIERSIIPENLVELSLAVLEIIRGQNHFLKKKEFHDISGPEVNFSQNSNFFFKTSYKLISSCQKSSNSTQPSLRNDSNKKI
jgi:hypothetical protein